MALSTGTVTVTKAYKTGRVIRAYGTIAIGADPLTYAAGGLITDFTGKVPSSKVPLRVKLEGKSGFIYNYVPGTTIANGKVMVWANTAGGADAALGEHSTAAVVAGVSGDTIRFDADFDALL